MIIAAILASAATPLPVIKSEIKADLNRRLLDGESARYIWPKRASKNAYCGFVNAKNRLGAYTGYRLFLTMTDGKGPVKVVVERNDSQIVPLLCKEFGYPVDAREAR